jgi:hypothetical protein
MASPFSRGKFGRGPYAAVSQIDLAAGLFGVSSSRATLTASSVIQPAGMLAGASSLTPDLRMYWEVEPPPSCGVEHSDDSLYGIGDYGVDLYSAGQVTAGWTVHSAPPFLCPETANAG